MENDSASSEEIEEQDVLEEKSMKRVKNRDDGCARLPIRAKPLFHNNHEDVDEFPL